jgi:hypothetical protein
LHYFDDDDGTISTEPVDPTNSSIGDMEEDPEHDQYFHKGVKQDIEHIFLRFACVLTKGKEDIEFIKAALRRSGVSDDDIKKSVVSTTSAGSVDAFPCRRNWNESSRAEL